MSNNIDERVVAMRFQDSQFASGIKRTLDSLASLKKGLNLDASKKSLQELDDAGKRFSLDNIGTRIEGVSGKFLALATIGVTALASITSKAIETGTQLVKSLTIDPAKMGLEEYETNLNAIQTILANTQSKGSTLDDVNKALDTLNTYSDQTIYNFSEMARNIGTFTAAGVDLDKSTNAIKGIANLAALSGSSSQQASTAMYQISQALAAGKVTLMDWNSIVNAGMGGQVFQDALKETARAHGVAVDALIKKNGSFRESLQEGWISADIMTETLSKFTGDLTAEQLKSMGYTEEQIAGIMQMATTAQDAATKVKTASQLVGTLQESTQSGWAKTWQIVLGDFEEAKDLWTGVNNVLGGMIQSSADARNKMLQDWKDLGGRTALIDAVKNAFNGLMSIFAPIKEAFREIFPPTTGEQLYNLTVMIRDFAARLTISAETADKVKSIFRGLFAGFDIGIQIIKGLLGVIGDFLGELFKGSDGVATQAVAWADWLTNVRNALKEGEGLGKFFSGLSNVVTAPIKIIREFAGWLKQLFSGDFGDGGASAALDNLKERLDPLGAAADWVAKAWEGMGDKLEAVWNFFQPLAQAMADFFGGIGETMMQSVQDMDYSAMLDTINTGLFAGLVLIIRRFMSNGINLDLGGGFLDAAKGALEGVTGTLQAMQTNLKADTLLKIAGALGILTISVVALSLIDSEGLTRALVAITIMFTQLAAAMTVFEKIGGLTSGAKLAGMAVGLGLLAVAIGILAASVAGLSNLDWEELAKGLTGVVALLGMVAGTAKLLQGNTAGMVTAGAGMILIATAIKILASAVEDFAEMDWATLARGFAGVGAALTALAIFTRLSELNKAGLAQSAGLILIAAALKIIASAVGDFAGMSWEELGRGLAAMAASLLLIAGAMYLMSGALPGAAALIVVSAALVILAGALEKMSGMSWEEIAKGLVTLAGALLIIAGGMYLMVGALPGAAALIVVAAALAILTPALLAMAGLSWEEIGKGLAMLAGVLAVIGVAGLLLTPVIPTLLGLGVAIGLIGVGVLAAGLGLLAFSAGLTALSVAGAAGTAAMVAMVGALIGLIPTVLAAIGEGIIQLALVVAQGGPAFIAAAVTLISSLLTAINTLAPQIIDTLVNLIMLLVQAVVDLVPQLAAAGLDLLTGLLNAIAEGLPDVIQAGTDVIVAFIRGIGDSAAQIAEAGADTVIDFVNSLATTIETKSEEMREAGGRLAKAIIDGMTGGLASGIGTIVNKAKEVASSALDAAKDFLGIHSPSKEFYKVGGWSTEGMANGLSRTAGVVATAAEGVGSSALTALKDSMSGMSDALSMDMDMAPVIRPVLDLTDVQNKAKDINNALGTPKLDVDTTATKAAATAEEYRNNQIAAQNGSGSGDTINLKFEQTNTSPKALPAIEIYRNTKNLISTAKGAIG